MSMCDLHDCQMQRVEVREYPGKTIEQCPRCEVERRERMSALCVPADFPSLNQRRLAMVSALNPPLELLITQLDTGYWHICGHGICNWVQVPFWPTDEATIRSHAFPEAGEDFLREVIRRANSWVTADETC